MKVISKITEIYKIKSISNISKIDLVLKIFSPRFQIYKKFQKWTFHLTDINHSKYEDEIKYMSFGWRERQCMQPWSLDSNSLSLSVVQKAAIYCFLSRRICKYSSWNELLCLYESDCTDLDESELDSGFPTGTYRLR